MGWRGKTGIAVAVVAVVVVALGLLIRHWVNGITSLTPPAPPLCSVAGATYDLDPAQAANAATISAEALRRKLPMRASEVAFAASLQESKLRNLDYGDRDSVGLFQQRPSQGWGPRVRLLDPVYAAGRFFDVLVRIPGWAALPVADVAQRVERSAYPDAYSGWVPTAFALARTFTGSHPAGITCAYPTPHRTADPATVAARQFAAQMGMRAVPAGRATVVVPVPTAVAGWQAASWLTAHGQALGVTSVSYGGRRWTRGASSWKAVSGPSDVRATLAATSP